MSIPLSQLTTWSNQGATVGSKNTHESIRTALTHTNSPISNKISSGEIKIYLQGSYKNDTNIRGDSDVDIVVHLTKVFSHNMHERTQEEKRLLDIHYQDATVYGWNELKRDVLIALEKYYGKQFVDSTGNKSIKLLPNNGRLKADIVPVIEHRKFSHFYGPDNCYYESGVKFYHKATNESIINYPEHHYKNGATKHQNTQDTFKHVVRIIKNARNYLIDKNLLAKDIAPSYFVQCLIYNVPDSCFSGDYSEATRAVLHHLYTNVVDNYVCQNGITPLFGTGKDQWNVPNAHTTIQALVHLWDNWYEI